MACGGVDSGADDVAVDLARRDTHSYANVDEVRVTHLELDITVLFDERGMDLMDVDNFRIVEEGTDEWIASFE